MIDIEMATKVYEAFGGCTTLYECSSPKQIMARVNEEVDRWGDVSYSGNLVHWLHIQLSCESIWAERAGCYDEWEATGPDAPAHSEQEILKRLAAIGLDIDAIKKG